MQSIFCWRTWDYSNLDKSCVNSEPKQQVLFPVCCFKIPTAAMEMTHGGVLRIFHKPEILTVMLCQIIYHTGQCKVLSHKLACKKNDICLLILLLL